MGNNIIGGARENVDGLKKMTSFSAKQVSVIKYFYSLPHTGFLIPAS